jgi:ribonuclease HII
MPTPVIGVDEAGRGCLAGPVVAAAVILDESKQVRGLTDSKLVPEPRREKLFERIIKVHRIGVGIASAQEIDEINILQASFLAMRRALEVLGCVSGHVLVDGHLRIPSLSTDFIQTAVVKGDLRCRPISAASIVAKVTRDRIMRELAKEFPSYGFEVHKGYGTLYHRERLDEVGPCREHRRTFRGVTIEQLVLEGLISGDESEAMAIAEGLVD